MSTVGTPPAAVNDSFADDLLDALKTICSWCHAPLPPERHRWAGLCPTCQAIEEGQEVELTDPEPDPVDALARAWWEGFNAARRELLGDDTPVIVPPVTSANVCDCDAYGLGPCPRCLAALAAE